MPVIESLKITLADMQRNHNKTVIQLVFLRHVSKWKDCDSGGSKLCLSGREKVSGNESALSSCYYNYTNFNSFPTLSFHGFFFHEAEFHNERLNNTGSGFQKL
jgi:hypothetical protein